jgi:hypothetical protein
MRGLSEQPRGRSLPIPSEYTGFPEAATLLSSSKSNRDTQNFAKESENSHDIVFFNVSAKSFSQKNVCAQHPSAMHHIIGTSTAAISAEKYTDPYASFSATLLFSSSSNLVALKFNTQSLQHHHLFAANGEITNTKPSSNAQGHITQTWPSLHTPP